jgi:uncharacterized protein
MSKVNYFELQADNPERAMAFYEKVFDWKFNKSSLGQGYWSFEAGPKEEPGLNGGLMKREFPGHENLITIFVESVDEALKAIEAAGGTIIHPKMPVTGIGWAAYFKDSEGNAAGIFQSDPGAK